MTAERQLTARGAQRRTQLLETATRLFAEQGYHPTSVADVVESLGVGKGVFYWYFPSKEDLLLEILRTAQRDRRVAQRDAIAGLEDPLQRLESGIRSGMEWMAEHRELVTVIRFAATEGRFADGLRRGEEIAVNDAATPLQEAIASGQIPDGDAQLLARAVLGVTQQLCASLIHGNPEADPIAVIDAAVAFCMSGISRAS